MAHQKFQQENSFGLKSICQPRRCTPCVIRSSSRSLTCKTARAPPDCHAAPPHEFAPPTPQPRTVWQEVIRSRVQGSDSVFHHLRASHQQHRLIRFLQSNTAKGIETNGSTAI